jgi:plasmid maintenance system antidote protein VapI
VYVHLKETKKTMGDLESESGVSLESILQIDAKLLSPQEADALGRAFGTTGKFWLNLQERYNQYRGGGGGRI